MKKNSFFTYVVSGGKKNVYFCEYRESRKEEEEEEELTGKLGSNYKRTGTHSGGSGRLFAFMN